MPLPPLQLLQLLFLLLRLGPREQQARAVPPGLSSPLLRRERWRRRRRQGPAPAPSGSLGSRRLLGNLKEYVLVFELL